MIPQNINGGLWQRYNPPPVLCLRSLEPEALVVTPVSIGAIQSLQSWQKPEWSGFLLEGPRPTHYFEEGATRRRLDNCLPGWTKLAAHAFGILIVYALLWFVFDRDTLDWHAVAMLSVWFMMLLIQRAEHRDTQALQTKLDELLHAHSQANNALR